MVVYCRWRRIKFGFEIHSLRGTVKSFQTRPDNIFKQSGSWLMIIERDETLDWLRHFTGGIFCSPATLLDTAGVSKWSLVVSYVAARVMTLVCQLWHCQPSFRKFTVFLNFPQLSYILLCKLISNKCPREYSFLFFSSHFGTILCKHRRWMDVGESPSRSWHQHPCHWNPLTAPIWCSPWTSANCLGYIYMSRCVELLPCDWLMSCLW